MTGLIFLKLGGSLITVKSEAYRVRPEVVERISREIHEARRKNGMPLLLGHGGGSFAHVSAARYQTHKGDIAENSREGFARVQNDVARLNRIVVGALLDAGENAVSVQPSAAAFAENGCILEWFTRPIESMLAKGIVPVVHGDVCIDRERGFCIVSTEDVFQFLSAGLKPERILMAGKTDGVLDREGQVIKLVTGENFPDVRKSLLPSDGIADVTGGMIHKVETSLKMAVEIEIINGLKPGIVARSLAGEKGLGTIIRPGC